MRIFGHFGWLQRLFFERPNNPCVYHFLIIVRCLIWDSKPWNSEVLSSLLRSSQFDSRIIGRRLQPLLVDSFWVMRRVAINLLSYGSQPGGWFRSAFKASAPSESDFVCPWVALDSPRLLGCFKIETHAWALSSRQVTQRVNQLEAVGDSWSNYVEIRELNGTRSSFDSQEWSGISAMTKQIRSAENPFIVPRRDYPLCDWSRLSR